MAVGLRKPAFTVLANLLLVFCFAGVCLKYLSRFLPESKPNRLAFEYGSYVKRASRQRIDWHPFDKPAFDLARSENKLIFLEIGCSFSRFSNILTNNYFVEPELTRVLNNHFVSVRADLSEMPWLADQVALNGPELIESGCSVILVLAPSGEIVAETSFLPLFTEGRTKGLIDWLSDIAIEWVRRPKTVLSRARAIKDDRLARVSASQTAGLTVDQDLYEFAATMVRAADPAAGVFASGITPVSSVLPSLLTDAGFDSSPYLLSLRKSPCYDQLGGGFFFSATAPRFQDPQVGKAVGMNCLLAAEYAHASIQGERLFEWTAKDTLYWAIHAMQDANSGMFRAGECSDEHPVTGSAFYDWTENELSSANVTSFRVSDPSGAKSVPMLASTYDIAGIEVDRRTASASAADRKPPPVDEGVYADVNGQVIASLYKSNLVLHDDLIATSANRAYDAAMRTFVQPLGDCRHAPMGLANTTGYCGDYVWLARACIERFNATGDESAIRRAETIMLRCAELFAMPSGAYASTLGSLSSVAAFELQAPSIADSPIESVSSVAIRNWHDLAAALGKPDYDTRAQDIANASRGSLPSLGWRAAGMVRASSRLFLPSVVMNGVQDAAPRRSNLDPFRTIRASKGAAAWTIRKPGIYVVQSTNVEGPLDAKTAAARLSEAAR
jgi:uncharacterized protein YyaL (SSP411 family)